MALGVLTVAVSAVADVIAGVESRGLGCCTVLPGAGATAVAEVPGGVVLPAVSTGTEVVRTGLAGGNNSCDRAITISERNRARKKRLSIQGTGS
jgi:hypothetical protein